MIHIGKIILFLLISPTIAYAQSASDKEIIISEKRITELVNVIANNLSGTDVLECFKIEQQKWLEYRKSRIETMYPEYINGNKMYWGSILSYDISKTILNMNLERIEALEDYLNGKNETGTDGEGKFIEYVNNFNNKEK